MGYTFKKGLMYRMPTHFGPACGPRQGPERRNQFLDQETEGEERIIYVSFRTNVEQLKKLVPVGVGLTVGEKPVVTFTVTYMKGLLWLAGRGYNTLGVSFPVVFKGRKDHVKGSFLTVLWENLTDPILTGREELGFSKIYADIPEPNIYRGKIHCTASWMGFRFIDLILNNVKELSLEEAKSISEIKEDNNGLIHYKYIPKTGIWGEPDVAYVTFAPIKNAIALPKLEAWKGEGEIKLHKATWEDLPTQYTIVNALQELEIKEYCGAYMVRIQGSRVDDISSTRILE